MKIHSIIATDVIKMKKKILNLYNIKGIEKRHKNTNQAKLSLKRSGSENFMRPHRNMKGEGKCLWQTQ